jgi:hypothetical protein
MSEHPEAGLSNTAQDIPLNDELDRTREIDQPAPSAEELFHLYEQVVENRPGTRDAEIFEKIREWTFSDFSFPAHEFAGITQVELEAWQTRNRINLSSGHIRPDPIDLLRGYAWGQMRMAASANRLHSDKSPPSALEIDGSSTTRPARSRPSILPRNP